MQLSAVVPSVHLWLVFSNTNVQELVLDAICTSVSGFTSYLQNTMSINTSCAHYGRCCNVYTALLSSPLALFAFGMAQNAACYNENHHQDDKWNG